MELTMKKVLLSFVIVSVAGLYAQLATDDELDIAREKADKSALKIKIVS